MQGLKIAEIWQKSTQSLHGGKDISAHTLYVIICWTPVGSTCIFPERSKQNALYRNFKWSIAKLHCLCNCIYFCSAFEIFLLVSQIFRSVQLMNLFSYRTSAMENTYWLHCLQGSLAVTIASGCRLDVPELLFQQHIPTLWGLLMEWTNRFFVRGEQKVCRRLDLWATCVFVRRKPWEQQGWGTARQGNLRKTMEALKGSQNSEVQHLLELQSVVWVKVLV